MTMMNKLMLLTLSMLCLSTTPVLAEESKTHNVTASVYVDVPVAEAWSKLQDFGLAHHYVPNLSKTEIMTIQKNGVGAHRKVYDMDGGYIDETITEWYEGSGFLIRLHEGEAPLAPFTMSQFLYQLNKEGEGTRVVLTISYRMPWGIVGEKLSDWVIIGLMSDNVGKVAAGMKHYYETGQSATDEDRARLIDQVRVDAS